MNRQPEADIPKAFFADLLISNQALAEVPLSRCCKSFVLEIQEYLNNLVAHHDGFPPNYSCEMTIGVCAAPEDLSTKVVLYQGQQYWILNPLFKRNNQSAPEVLSNEDS